MVLKQLEADLQARGIPDYARRLAERFNYNPLACKAVHNPEELELLHEARRIGRQTA